MFSILDQTILGNYVSLLRISEKGLQTPGVHQVALAFRERNNIRYGLSWNPGQICTKYTLDISDQNFQSLYSVEDQDGSKFTPFSPHISI